MNACLPVDSLSEQTELLFESPELGTDAWWQRVRDIGTPLLSRPAAVADNMLEFTFLWRATPATQAVFIDVYSHTPHITQELTGLTRIGQTDVWYWRTRLPADWCGSYFFLPATAADLPVPEGRSLRRQWWINLMERNAQADPFNPLPAHNSGWGLPLAGIQADKTAVHLIAKKLRDESNGWYQLRWASNQLRNERDIWLFDTRLSNSTETVPLIILLDGHYWAKQEFFLRQLENLTRAGRLPAAQYVFIAALSPRSRSEEMPCNPDFWRALQRELLPALHARFSITDNPRTTLIAGQSFGGLSAVYAALNWPGRFGRALSLSGSFWWPDAAETGAGGMLVQQVINGLGAGADLDIALSIGCYEQEMLGVNQAMRDALVSAKLPVTYREFRGGHDWLCWREEMLQQLIRLLGKTSV